MEAVRRTTSSEGADLDLDGLGQLILPGGGDSAWPEAIMDAPSFPNFFASPPIFLSDATAATAPTNSCLGQPGVAMASEGAMADVGASDQLVSGDNASAAIASSSFSFFALPSTFLLDATTNRGEPAASANTSSIQPSISTMSWEGIEIDLDVLGQALLHGDNAWLGAPIDAPSSPSFFASPSSFPSYATTITTTTKTCSLSQPASITMDLESQGAMVNLDLDEPGLQLQVATIASSSTSFFDSPPSNFPLLDVTTSWETPASTNTSLINPVSPPRGPAANLSLQLGQQLISGDNAWSEVAAIASSSPSYFDSPSTFLSDDTTNGCTPARTKTCLIQPSILPVPRSTLSQGEAVDSDHLRAQPLSLSPSVFPADAETLTARASANTCGIRTYLYINERIHQAMDHISEYVFQTYRCRDVLVQVWVPAKLGDADGRLELRTYRAWRQAYSLHAISESTPVGLPAGRIFIKKFYISGEPVSEAQRCVIELIMPTREGNSISEVDTICRAIQAVNLTATNVLISKFNNASYKDSLPEVLEILRAACAIHELPLAQTWATCAHQGKRCRHHSDDNCRYCISTIDVACYVSDHRMQFFHKACSEQHLLPGQGVVGKAFTTNQACFLPDIGSSSEQEYPLSHHAKTFKLKGATAIRLRCTRTGTTDFVLEFFLPTNCEVENEQTTMMDFLWVTVQSLSKTLRVVTNKEMQDDTMCEMNKINSLGLQKNKKAKRRKPMARRSPVWKSFTEVMVGDIVKAKCNHCGLELCCDSKNGTSTLISHLKRCKLNTNNRITGPL